MITITILLALFTIVTSWLQPEFDEHIGLPPTCFLQQRSGADICLEPEMSQTGLLDQEVRLSGLFLLRTFNLLWNACMPLLAPSN